MDIKCLMDLDKIEYYKQGLSAYRMKKVDKCKLVKNKAQSLGAGYLLAMLLKDRGIDEPVITYSENGHGKPYMENDENIHFSITHSEHMVAVCMDNALCGIDIEMIRSFSPAVLNRFFSEYDKKLIENAQKQNEEKARLIFTASWTKKEALGKLSGKGLDFEDHLQMNAFDDRYLKDNGIYIKTDKIEEDFVMSVSSIKSEVKNVSPRKIVFEQIIENKL